VKARSGASPAEVLLPALPYCAVHWQIFEVPFNVKTKRRQSINKKKSSQIT
jgi:hypothetical protein